MNKKILKEAIIYAARNKLDKELDNSSSGAIFPLLANNFISKGYGVVSAFYNYDNNKVEYKIFFDLEDLNMARGSKYISSNPNNILKEITQYLKTNINKKIMIFALRCHIAGFKSFLDRINLSSRCIFVDIICHGSASGLIWEKYISVLEKKYNNKVSYINFKDKRKGWLNPTAFVKINNSEILIKKYTKLFYDGIIMRLSCYKCPYCSIDSTSDITIGDYWGIENAHPEMYSKKGTSLVILHTEDGIKIFEEIKADISYVLSDKYKFLQPHLIKPLNKPIKRKIFWKDYNEKGIIYVLNKYGKKTLREKINIIKNKILIKIKGII